MAPVRPRIRIPANIRAIEACWSASELAEILRDNAAGSQGSRHPAHRRAIGIHARWIAKIICRLRNP